MLNSLKAVVLGGSVLAGVLGVAQSASASPVEVEQVRLVRGGTFSDWMAGTNIIFDDAMDNGNPLTGPNFSNGSPSSYTFHNLQNLADFNLAFSETGGRLQMNGEYGLVRPNAEDLSPNRSIGLILLTNTADPDRGLSKSTSFAAGALFAYQAPAAGYGYMVRLADRFSDNSDYADLRIINDGAGSTINFRRQDFSTGTITHSVAKPLTVPDGASFIALGLGQEDAGSGEIQGYYAFTDANGNLLGNVNHFGQTTIFNGVINGVNETHTRFEIRAIAPVPEPEGYAMLLAGLCLMGVIARRRKNRHS